MKCIESYDNHIILWDPMKWNNLMTYIEILGVLRNGMTCIESNEIQQHEGAPS